MKKLQYIIIFIMTVLLVMNIYCSCYVSGIVLAQETTDSMPEEQDGIGQDELGQKQDVIIATKPELLHDGDDVSVVPEGRLEYIIGADQPCVVIVHIEKTMRTISDDNVIVLTETEEEEIDLTMDSLEYSLIFEEEGEYTVFVTAKEITTEETTDEATIDEKTADEETKTRMARFIIDKTAPVTNISGVENGAYYKEKRTIQFTVADLIPDLGNTEVNVWKDGYPIEVQEIAWVTADADGYRYQAQLTLEQEGSYQIVFKAVDQAGNVGESVTVSFWISRTVPVINAEYSADDKVWTNQDIVFRAIVSDDRVGIKKIVYKVNGKTIQKVTFDQPVYEYKYEFTVTDSANKASGYPVTVEAVNNCGISSKLRRRVYIDKEAPRIALTGVEKGVHYNTDCSVTAEVQDISYDGTEVNFMIRRTVDGKMEDLSVPVFRPKQYKDACSRMLTKEGEYEIYALAIDGAGNTTRSNTLSFVIDKTPPVIQIQGTDNYKQWDQPVTVWFGVEESYYKGNRVTISGTRTDMHGVTQKVELPKLVCTGKTSKLSQTFEQDGIYEFHVEAKDQAGNENHGEIHFTIDRTAPQIHQVKQFDGGHYQKFNLEDVLEGLFEDTTVISYRILLNGVEYNGTDLISEEGKYNLFVVAEDALGHVSSETAEFIIDRSPAGNKTSTSSNFVYNSGEDDEQLPGWKGLLMIPLILCVWVLRKNEKGSEKEDESSCI